MPPVAPLDLAVAGGMLALAGGALAAAWALTRAWPAEVRRKTVHVAAGGLALGFPWIFPSDVSFALFIAAVTLGLAGLRAARTAGRMGSLARTVHGVARDSWGDLLLPVSIALLWILQDDTPIRYVLPLAILTVADAAAALTGIAYGRLRFTAEAGAKTLEGTVMFFLVTLLTAMICLLLLSEVSRGAVIAIGAALAAFATLVEVDSWKGLDNLFLPMGALIFLDRAMTLDPVLLGFTTTLLVCGLLALGALGRGVGVPMHDLRVAGIGIFLLMAVTTPWNAGLPTAVIIAQLAIDRLRPADQRGGALGVVGLLACLGFASLALGDLSGHTMIGFYTLAAAAGLAGLLAGLAGHDALPRRLARAGGIAVGGGAAWGGAMALTPADALWAAHLPGSGPLLILATALVAAARAPHRQDRSAVWILGGSAAGAGSLALASALV